MKLSEKLKQIKEKLPLVVENYPLHGDLFEAIQQAESYEAMRSPEEVRERIEEYKQEDKKFRKLGDTKGNYPFRIKMENLKWVLKKQ